MTRTVIDAQSLAYHHTVQHGRRRKTDKTTDCRDTWTVALGKAVPSPHLDSTAEWILVVEAYVNQHQG